MLSRTLYLEPAVRAAFGSFVLFPARGGFPPFSAGKCFASTIAFSDLGADRIA